MNRVFCILVAAILLTGCGRETGEVQRPNIVFIITDDHAYQALSAYDNTLIQTPNIDRIAEEGMLFERAFVTNSICSPSRAVILTGKFSHLNGVRDNIDVFDSEQETFPKMLQRGGYETAIYGKWHLKSEPQGFDYWEVLPGQGHYYHPEFRTPDGQVKEQGYVTDIITDKALNYLDKLRDREKPFMLMYNHKAPHRQWWPAMEDLGEFREVDFPEPGSLFDTYTTKSRASVDAEMRISDHMGLSSDNKIHPKILDSLGYEEFLGWYESSYTGRLDRLSPEEQKAWNRVYGPINEEFSRSDLQGEELTSWKYQRYLEDYLGVIRSVDRNVGKLLDYLDEHGLADNTLIVYTSDQGFYLGEHGWFDKRFMYEESFRTPLLVRYPERIKAGSVNSKLVQNIDFAPTVLELAGLEPNEAMQGRSLTPLFDTQDTEWRDALYYHYYEYPGIHMVKRHYGIRTERYKLIRYYYDIEAWELYDLEMDPREMINVYDNPEYRAIQKELHERLEELRVHYQDDSDARNRE